MSNPWLTIPLSDYEEHMSSPHVRQLPALSQLFGQALQQCAPESVAVLGIAGGNGLEQIDPARTRRIVGIDINPAYLEATRRRFGSLPGLELHCADLAQEALGPDPVQLCYAALIFEHAGLEVCLDNACSLVAPGGSLAVVLQLPAGDPGQNISFGSHPSIESLRQHFELVAPSHLSAKLEKKGFQMVWQVQQPLPSGKAFWMGIFRM